MKYNKDAIDGTLILLGITIAAYGAIINSVVLALIGLCLIEEFRAR